MYRIILVDDESMSRKSLDKILTSANSQYQIVGEAANGAEALELIRLQQPHLIITDISMPIMDGIELIQRLRQDGYDGEIIILSGYGEFEYAQAALRHGVVDYLLKPLKEELVVELVGRLFDRCASTRQKAMVKNQLLAPVISAAERISTALWAANAPVLSQETENLLKLLTHQELSYEERRTLLENAASLIQNQLEDRLLISPWEIPYDEPGYTTLESSFRDWLERKLAETRDKRNWGRRSATQQAMDYINQHFSDSELSLEKVLEPLDISTTYFYHLLMEETGMSYIAYLTNVRMEHAKALLTDTSLKTYEVGQRCGYPDYSHFTKRFKRMIGLSPSEFRKRMQE
ncbi:hypothetical protein A8L34_05535 [Bacillus sp. FJAT-27264]|uniref:response regulator transcription factor n=1 Tax=Paenibacillus sp. (strain DSM 101736 / FJAT-27264) TaxID=1850362 RepID=UPI000807EDDC|nr:response regulator [Bacillus sp. FJAT-27264]OBZ19007.1 hypothetical protein A8L34_05535 [Bacillus sp. FJAT-27264]